MKKGTPVNYCTKCGRIEKQGRWVLLSKRRRNKLRRSQGFVNKKCKDCCDCITCNCEEVRNANKRR